ncbi:MAG: nitroreductase family protein [Aminipila sp.]
MMIKINYDKCSGCLECVKVCPFTVIDVEMDKPKVKDNKSCLKCMHCAATCHMDAITSDGKKAVLDREKKELPEDFPQLLEEHILARRSFRHFKEEPVNREILEHAIELACWAPSAKNEQGTKYIVVDKKETIKYIMDEIIKFAKETGAIPEIVSEYARGNNPVMGTAPTLLLAYAPNTNINPLGDTFIKLTTIELMLQSQGIGTCFAGYLMRLANGVPALKELFMLPENNSFYGALMMGYPENEDYSKIPERVIRQDIRWI